METAHHLRSLQQLEIRTFNRLATILNQPYYALLLEPFLSYWRDWHSVGKMKPKLGDPKQATLSFERYPGLTKVFCVVL
jgi:hypothetical protein